MTLIEQFHAALVSSEVRLAHYPGRAAPQFFLWRADGLGGWSAAGSFVSLEELILAAWAAIDPASKPLPESVPVPPLPPAEGVDEFSDP